MKKEYLSTEYEPALNDGIRTGTDPSEETAAPVSVAGSELERLRHSIGQEPFCRDGSKRSGYLAYITERGEKYSCGFLLWVSLAAGLAGALFAVPGCFVNAGAVASFRYFTLVVFAPFLEEVLKQSGMLWLLEKRPWLVRYSEQFFLSAFSGGLVFAVLENLIYYYVYLAALPQERRLQIIAFRWVACTVLHVCCTLISALGLRRAWKLQYAGGKPFEIQNALPFFVIAVAVHGAYNLCAVLFLERLFR